MTDENSHCLFLLGPPAWRDAQGVSPWPAERRLQMLAWMAHYGDWVGRDRLAALLWPRHDRVAAQRNLRKQLFRLHELPGLPAVQERGRMLRWSMPTDVQQFESALQGGDDAVAVACWRALPWQDFDADWSDGEGGLGEWLAAERARLANLWRGAMLRLARADPLQARQRAQALLRADPLDEEALRVLMRSHVDSGQRADAAAAYTLFAQALQRTLQLQPGAQSAALLREATDCDAPRAPSTEVAPDFVGRTAEQRDLESLLARPGCQWVTLVGAGGSGKTRLLRSRFAAGLGSPAHWRVWVDLEDLTDTRQALCRVAAAFGQNADDHGVALAKTCKALSERRALLVLDNMEQLTEAAGQLAEAFAACPGVQVVASSRVRLGVPGEHLMTLGGLPWPAPEDADRALAFDAVRLFVLHAQRHCAGFNAVAQAGAVARLCAWVEGNPLALLLAAPWTRHMGVAAILAELERDANAMLCDGAKAGPARQHSMQASFEHSWRLLVSVEREALARLAVFLGSFTLEAAQQVAAAPLAVLAALLDKSLLQRLEVTGNPAAPRFSLHPLMAQFARTQGGPDTHAKAVAAHTAHFMRQLASLPPASQPGARAAHLRATAVEADDFRRAWAEAVRRRAAPQLERAVEGWSRHWHGLGRFSEGLKGLSAAEPLLAGQAHAHLQSFQSWLCANIGDTQGSLRLAREALAVLRRSGDDDALLRCRSLAAGALWRTGASAAARRTYLAVLEHAERYGEHRLASNALYELANIDHSLGHLASALEFNARALVSCARADANADDCIIGRSRLLLASGRAADAVHVLEDLLAQRGEQMSPFLSSQAYCNLAEGWLDLDQPERALALYKQARALNSRGESPLWTAWLDLSGARLALRMSQLKVAHQRLTAAAELSPDFAFPAFEHNLVCDAAAWLLASGEAAAAHDLLAALLGQPARQASVHARARRMHGRRRACHGVSLEALKASTRDALRAAALK